MCSPYLRPSHWSGTAWWWKPQRPARWPRRTPRSMWHRCCQVSSPVWAKIAHPRSSFWAGSEETMAMETDGNWWWLAVIIFLWSWAFLERTFPKGETSISPCRSSSEPSEALKKQVGQPRLGKELVDVARASKPTRSPWVDLNRSTTQNGSMLRMLGVFQSDI